MLVKAMVNFLVSHQTLYEMCHKSTRLTRTVNKMNYRFESNRSYLQHPSKEVDDLWEALYPATGHGTFHDPAVGPEKKVGFAGFHQMHCVVSCFDYDLIPSLCRRNLSMLIFSFHNRMRYSTASTRARTLSKLSAKAVRYPHSITLLTHNTLYIA